MKTEKFDWMPKRWAFLFGLLIGSNLMYLVVMLTFGFAALAFGHK